MRDLGLPLLVLGGGGYTVRNVARCWSLETAVLLDTDLPTQLPQHEYWEYFAPDFSLTPDLTNRYENGNSREYLESLIEQTQQMLKTLSHSPSVQMTDTGTEGSDLDKPRLTKWNKVQDDEIE